MGEWYILYSSVTSTDPMTLLQPHIYRPGKPVAPLSLPSVTSPADAALNASQSALVNDGAIETLVGLIHASHSSPWQHVALSSFPDAATLRHCVDLYFRR